MLEQVLFLVLLSETAYHTSTKVVRLDESLTVPHVIPIVTVAGGHIAKPHSSKSRHKAANVATYAEQGQLVRQVRRKGMPLHV